MIDGIGERVFQQHGRILEFMGETDCRGLVVHPLFERLYAEAVELANAEGSASAPFPSNAR